MFVIVTKQNWNAIQLYFLDAKEFLIWLHWNYWKSNLGKCIVCRIQWTIIYYLRVIKNRKNMGFFKNNVMGKLLTFQFQFVNILIKGRSKTRAPTMWVGDKPNRTLLYNANSRTYSSSWPYTSFGIVELPFVLKFFMLQLGS